MVDSQTVVRAGLRLLIESWRGMKIVGDTGDPSVAVAMAEGEKPDVILLELDLAPRGEALDLLPKLLSVAGESRILILTGEPDLELHYHAIQMGAWGLVLKNQSARELHKAILKVRAGEMSLGPTLTTSIIKKMSGVHAPNKVDEKTAKIALLTKRERELVALVAEGFSSREIAKRLFISETTVRHHLTSIFSKLRLANRLELIVFLFRHKVDLGPSKPPAPSISVDAINQEGRRGRAS
jgi:DNA-binding NarL/FixJ family response regulator